jgi:two-component system chemotaxis response regulator CheY
MQRKILVVDDSALARRFVRQCAEIAMGSECSFLEASNGKDALATLASNPDIWLVLTDLNMPLMDGFEFLKQVKSSPYAKTHVLVVSSIQNEARSLELKQQGAIAVLPKPISPAKIKEIIAPLNKGGIL